MYRGSEFRIEVESNMLENYGIRIEQNTTGTPQANAMVERAHQTT
jgi:transposase InsO family protein